MILDKDTMFADNIDVAGSPTVLDTMVVNPGPGEPITVFVTADAAVTGVTGVTIQDSADNVTFSDLITWTGNPAGVVIAFTIPSTAKRYLQIALVGTPAGGNWSAGISLQGVQLAK